MANGDFDPDAFIKGMGVGNQPPPQQSTFDPDAYMREQGLQMPQTMRERERGVRQAIAAEPRDIPAGFAPAAIPERTLPMPPTTFAERAGQWGDVGIGAAQGVPAWLSGGVLGDIEAGVRPFASGVFGVSPQNAIPTTVEGGYLGPRGYDVLGAPKNEYQAMGRGLAAAAMPNVAPTRFIPRALGVAERQGGRFLPLPGEGDELPTAPKVTTPRTNAAGQKLSPDLLPSNFRDDGGGGGGGGMPAAAPVGAARISPLDGLDPAAIQRVAKDLHDTYTQESLEDTLEQASPHKFAHEIGEPGDPMWNAAEGVYTKGGQGGRDISSAIRMRAREAPDRIAGILDRAFGTPQDLSMLRRLREIDQNREASPFYQAFRDMQITPTPEMLDTGPGNLMDRLRAADVFGMARRLAAERGVPYDEAFDTLGTPEGGQRFPTAASWDLIKRALDAKIQETIDPVTGRPSAFTGPRVQMKNDLINSINNHPNQQIGQLWRTGRAIFGSYEDINRAEQLGAKLASGQIPPNEVRFLTAGYTDPQWASLRVGMRDYYQQQMGKPGPQSNVVVRRLMGGNNQDIARQVIGDERANAMEREVQDEHDMFDKGLVTGSRTAPKTENAASWNPPPEGFTERGLSLVGEPLKFGKEIALGALKARQEARAAQIRNDAAKIYTMQGPERNAALLWIYQHGLNYTGRSRGGRVVRRASGGRVNTAPPIAGARQATNHHWYVKDPARPGKFLMVLPTSTSR